MHSGFRKGDWKKPSRCLGIGTQATDTIVRCPQKQEEGNFKSLCISSIALQSQGGLPY